MNAVDGAAYGRVSTAVIDPYGDEPGADLVEIRTDNGEGAVSTMRLSRYEAEMLAVVFHKIVDDSGRRDEPVAEVEGGRSITRDALVEALLRLPRQAEIDVQIGTEHIAITGLGPAWKPSERWFALQCYQADVKCLQAIPPEEE